MKAKTGKKVEIYFVETPDHERRLKKVIEILADGIFAYLKENGYFMEEKKEDQKPPLNEPISL